MAFWLVKSEPEAWSWQDHVKAGVAEWDGVRNAQASNHLKAMRNGDHAFFYHSGKNRQVVGTLEVVKEYYPDPSDASGRFGMVDFQALDPLPRPVGLGEIKADERLGHLALVRQSRLSVMPIDDEAWQIILQLAGTGP